MSGYDEKPYRDVQLTDAAAKIVRSERIACGSSLNKQGMNLFARDLAEISENLSRVDEMFELNYALNDINDNMVHCLKALMEQNFILMRKVDEMNRRLEELEEKIE